MMSFTGNLFSLILYEAKWYQSRLPLHPARYNGGQVHQWQKVNCCCCCCLSAPINSQTTWQWGWRDFPWLSQKKEVMMLLYTIVALLKIIKIKDSTKPCVYHHQGSRDWGSKVLVRFCTTLKPCCCYSVKGVTSLSRLGTFPSALSGQAAQQWYWKCEQIRNNIIITGMREGPVLCGTWQWC